MVWHLILAGGQPIISHARWRGRCTAGRLARRVHKAVAVQLGGRGRCHPLCTQHPSMSRLHAHAPQAIEQPYLLQAAIEAGWSALMEICMH